MRGKIKPLSFAFFIALTGCSSVTDKIPTVKIERKKPKVIKSVQANYTAPKVEQAEAAMVCENDNMRSRAQDQNSKNDTARVLILEEGGRSSNVIADVEVNCRDYFQSARSRQFVSAPRVISSLPLQQTSYVTSQSIQASPKQPEIQRLVRPITRPQQGRVLKTSSQVKAADGYYYSIKKGDTMYRIAKDNCSSVKDISELNGIYDPTKIEIHQIIRLPAKKCNARK